jgi:hypothetical protein
MSFRYRVSGVIRERGTGRPLRDLVVRAWDADVLADDLLGETPTDADGRFAIVFTQLQFRDLVESRPDLYLTISDPSGSRLLLSTRQAVRHDAGVEERYALEIPPDALD